MSVGSFTIMLCLILCLHALFELFFMLCHVMAIFHLLCQFFRVYGKKVTEVPPVGTRLEYRPHGMCHILMKKLEKVINKTHICPL